MPDLLSIGVGLIKFGGSDTLPKGNYCLGYWANKTPTQRDKVIEKKIVGDRNWILDWRPYLVNMTPVEGEVKKVPVAELKKNNWLRKKDGTYAPVCGITLEQSTACDQQLYWDNAHQYPIDTSFYEDEEGSGSGDTSGSGEFDSSGSYDYSGSGSGATEQPIFKADAFWEYCKTNYVTINSTYGTSYRCGIEVKLYDYDGNEYSYGSHTNYHIVAPWETTSVDYSVFIGRPDDVYLVDRIVGNSGLEWSGIVANEEEFDGIDVSAFKLARTGISPGCSTAKYVNGRFSTRNFFYNYAAGTSNSFGLWGESDCSIMANGSREAIDSGSSIRDDSGYNNAIFWGNGHYPITMTRGYDSYGCHLKTSAIYARNNNFKESGKSFVDSPVPVSEGGYHANNTFLCCMEVAFGTKFLHNNTMFGSGVSSNHPCSNEDEWKLNGGVKYTYNGTTYYKKWSDTCQYNSSYNWSCTMNTHHAKFQCNEPQIAASLMTEMGLYQGSVFTWNGGDWSYSAPTRISQDFDIASLGQGEMNCRIYKKINFTPTSYTGYNVTLNLVCGLMEGVDTCGDILAYANGGCELVCISDSKNSSYPSYPVVLNCFLETDQSKWHTEDFYSRKDGTATSLENYFFLPYNYTFDFENAYIKVADGVTTSAYSRRKASYAPFASEFVAGYQKDDNFDGSNKGETFYSNTKIDDYSTTGCGESYRHRRSLRLRSASFLANCSPRSIYVNYRADNPGTINGCLTQVLLTD